MSDIRGAEEDYTFPSLGCFCVYFVLLDLFLLFISLAMSSHSSSF